MVPSNYQPLKLRRSSRLRQARVNLEGNNDDASTCMSTTLLQSSQKKKRTPTAKTCKNETNRSNPTRETKSDVLIINSIQNPDDNLLLLDLGKLIRGNLIKRPSATIRSPYVADVALLDENGQEGQIIQAHSPALDVGGLCVPSSTVFMTERPPGGKTSHAIELLFAPAPDQENVEGDNGILVGIHPSLAEKLTEKVLERGLLEDIIGFGAAKFCTNKSSPKKRKKKSNAEEDKPLEGVILRRQRTYGDSRVDFELTDHGSSKPRSLIEVKNVVCSDYAANMAPVKTGPNHCVIKSDSENYSRTAIFPWGRVGQTFEGKKVVSERAIKHMRNLGNLTATDESINAVVMFVINRSDCEHMRACHEACPVFATELSATAEKGCIVTSFRVKWTLDGKAYFDGIVPVTM